MDFVKKYETRQKAKIYVVALLLVCALFVFTACNTQAVVNDDGTVTEPTNIIAKFLNILNENIGNLGWTVVVFTIILKTALSPLDFWQKNVMRKNAKAMERMKPKLEKLQKQYGNNKEMMQQKQMQLYKEEKYSMLGACLPTILTLVIFVLVFSGFNKMVNFQNANEYAQLANVYEQAVADDYTNAYNAKLTELGNAAFDAAKDNGANDSYAEEQRQAALTNADNIAKAVEAGLIAKQSDAVVAKGQQAVVDVYEPNSWLWVHNVFISDAWKESVPTYETFAGSGLGKLNVGGVLKEDYERVMGGLLGTGGWGKNGKWNGLLILPILSVVLSFVTQKLTQSQNVQPPVDPNNPSANAMGANMKVMQYTMPIIFGVFALLYSASFTIYIFTSSLYSVIFQVAFNLIAKVLDKKEEDDRMSSTFK